MKSDTPPAANKIRISCSEPSLCLSVAVLFALLVVAVLLCLNLWGHTLPLPAITPTDAKFTSQATVRTVGKELFDHEEEDKCSSCHEDMSPPETDPKTTVEFHERIVLQHGRNNRCFNCHHHDPKKRDFFVTYDDSKIPYLQVVELCAKCHGPIYRDWKNGIHGRRNGYWNKQVGKQKNLLCIACHDPHQPHFKALESAPAPHYLHSEPGRKQK